MKKVNFKAIAVVFLSMILLAVADNKGVFIPLFKSDFSINDTRIGFVLTAASLGFIIFTYIGGALCEKFGQKKVIIGGLTIIILSLIVLSKISSFVMLLISMFTLNIGLAFIEISANTILPILFITFQAVFMNLMHFCYGFGATITQRVTGILVERGMNWRTIYVGIATLFLALLIFTLFTKMPEPHEVKKDDNINKYDAFKNKFIYLYMIGLGFYVFAEVGTSNWFINFMRSTYSLDDNKGSLYLASFFGIFTVGRLVGGLIVEKLGYLNSVLYFLGAALILYTTGILIGQRGLFIISASGFFFSIVFPTIVLSVSKVFKENSSYSTGIILTGSSFINMVLNMFIGFLNDNIGVYRAFYLIPISLLISVVCVLIIYKSTKEILC
jgi:fucose permease